MASYDNAQNGSQSPVTKEIQSLPENVKTQAVEAGSGARAATEQLLDKATEHRPENTSSRPTQADGKEALIRNQGGQAKTQAALSPTDHGKSQTQSQARGRGMSPGR